MSITSLLLTVLLSLSCGVSLGSCSEYTQALSSPQELLRLYSSLQERLGAQYSGKERLLRLAVFRKALKFVERQNKQTQEWQVDVNKFSLMTVEEKAQYLGYNSSLSHEVKHDVTLSDDVTSDEVPVSVNWVAAGAVTKAKDQARCGSCWTFGSTCAIEGAYQIATGKLKSFSEQELLHCVYKMRNGCTGGFNSDAIQWVVDHKHMATRRNLPYIAKDTQLGDCGYEKWENGLKAGLVTSLVAVGNTEVDSIRALSKGPLATSVDVTNNFFYYKSGVLRDTDCSPISLSHAIAAVAYSDTWFLVKNSWGDDWGLEGFIKLARGHHNCGTWIHPYQAVVTKSGTEDDDPEDAAATVDPDEEITTQPPTEEPCEDTMINCRPSACTTWVWKEMCKKTCGEC